MPNHVTNRIVCTGPIEDVAEFKKLMIVKDKENPAPARFGESGLCFDLNRVIPRPEILERVIVPPRLGPNGRFMLYENKNSDIFAAYKEVEATPEEQATINGFEQKDWYDWSVENWGTKWNSYSYRPIFENATYEFSFDTAWSPPIPVLDTLVDRFPNVKFDIAWFDEGWNHAGNGVLNGDSDITSVEHIGVEPDEMIYEKVYGHPPIDADSKEEDRIWASICKSKYYTEHAALTRTLSFHENLCLSRLGTNFTCVDVASASDENGYFDLTSQTYSDDPEFTEDQLTTFRRVHFMLSPITSGM